MSDITLSAGVRQNLLSLQSTASLLTTTQNRLATGKKVNNAFDNPTSFFTSQSLTNRANSLSALLDQVGQAQQTLQAANQGLTSITSLLQQGLSIAQQALQAAGPGTLSYPLARAVSPGGEVVGIDLAPGMIELAQRETPPGLPVRFELMDMEELRFPNHSFDSAICGHGLQFVPDLRRALSETRRVLKSGSRLAASVPVDPSQPSAAQAILERAVGGLAALLPELPNGLARLRGDDDVHVDQDTVRARRHQRTDGRFPGPHQAHQHDLLHGSTRKARQARLRARSAAVSAASDSSIRCSATRPAR